MLLRPIDAILVHLENRSYVIYYRGELWQLPRMKIDAASWQRRRPYTGAKEALYLSQKQAIDDRFMARKLRTLDLPTAVRGITLPRFEAWWEMHGFEWLKERLDRGSSPLAAHQSKAQSPKPSDTATADNQKDSQKDDQKVENKKGHDNSNNDSSKTHKTIDNIDTIDNINHMDATDIDIFAEMLAELTNEVLNQQR